MDPFSLTSHKKNTNTSSSRERNPSLYINPSFQPAPSLAAQQTVCGGSYDDHLFDEEDDDIGLVRALPSSMITWDRVRQYSSGLGGNTSNELILGISPPPPVTFYDDDDQVQHHFRDSFAQTPQTHTQSFYSKTGFYTFDLNSPLSNTNVPPSSRPLYLSRQNTSSSDASQLEPVASFHAPPRPGRRNSIQDSMNSIKMKTGLDQKQALGPLALLSSPSGVSHASISPPTSTIHQDPPQPEKLDQSLIKNGRRASLEFGLDIDQALFLPPPPQLDNIASICIADESPSPSPHLSAIPPPPQEPFPLPIPPVPVTSNCQPVVPMKPNRNRRSHNLSRTEEDFMKMSVVNNSNSPFTSATPQILEAPELPLPEQPPTTMVDSDIHPNDSYPNPSVPDSFIKQSVIASPTNFISTDELLTLFYLSSGLQAPHDSQNRNAEQIVGIPNILAMVQLGIALIFAEYSPDFFIDNKISSFETPINQNTRRPMRLHPATLKCSNVISHPAFQQITTESEHFPQFSHLINVSIEYLPFEIPADFHPRSYGVSLLLTASFSSLLSPSDRQVSPLQQSAIFFLALALITSVGCVTKRGAFTNPNPFNTTYTNDTDPLYYMSLLHDHQDYTQLHHFYAQSTYENSFPLPYEAPKSPNNSSQHISSNDSGNNHDSCQIPHALKLTRRSSNPHNLILLGNVPSSPTAAMQFDQQQTRSPYALHNENTEDTRTKYAGLPQIEHRTGLSFYQLTPHVRAGFEYTAQHSLPPPPFITAQECYIIGYMLWLKAAQQGYAPAMADLSWSRNTSTYGVAKSEVLAFNWVYQAALQGDCRGMNNLALHYRKGTGCRKDTARAYYWLQKAKSLSYPQVSVKTLGAVEKELNLVGVEPRNNPYLDPKYEQLNEQTDEFVVDTWSTWLNDSSLYLSQQYDFAATEPYNAQPARVTYAHDLTRYRKSVTGGYGLESDITIYNALIISAMIPRKLNLIVPIPQPPPTPPGSTSLSSPVITLPLPPQPVLHEEHPTLYSTTHQEAPAHIASVITTLPSTPVLHPRTPTASLPILPSTPQHLPPTPAPILPLPPAPLPPRGPSLVDCSIIISDATSQNTEDAHVSSQYQAPCRSTIGQQPGVTPRPSVGPQRDAPSPFQRRPTMSGLGLPFSPVSVQRRADQSAMQATLTPEELAQLQQAQQDILVTSPVSAVARRYTLQQNHGMPITPTGSLIMNAPIQPNPYFVSQPIPPPPPVEIIEEEESTPPQPITPVRSSVPNLNRIDSVRDVDPLEAYQLQQQSSKQHAQDRYYQQDHIPTQFKPITVQPIVPTSSTADATSNSNGVQTFYTGNDAGKLVGARENVVEKIDIRNTASPRVVALCTSVVGVASPTPLNATLQAPIKTAPPRPSVLPNVVKTVQFEDIPPPPPPMSSDDDEVITNSRIPVHTPSIAQHKFAEKFSDTPLSISSRTSTNSISTNYSVLAQGQPTPRNASTHQGAANIDQNTFVQVVKAHPIERSPDWDDATWKAKTRSHYKHVLAQYMKSTRDGYIINHSHLNSLAELRISYGVTQEDHQQLYHYCKRLFDEHKKRNEMEVARLFSDRQTLKKTMQKQHKTLLIEQRERELEEHKKKMALEAAKENARASEARKLNPSNKNVLCLTCKTKPSTKMIEPCKHIVVCDSCSPKVTKCPHCRSTAQAIVLANATGVYVDPQK